MNVLVVVCDPDPASFTARLGERVVEAAHGAGHAVRVNDLHAAGFDPDLTVAEQRGEIDGVPPELQRYADDLRWAQALVLVYPTWWGAQPAVLKGWFDRIFAPGVAWAPTPSGIPKPLLGNIRRIVAVTTHGSSKWRNALGGEPGKRTITRSIRLMCSWRTRTKWCALYGADEADDRRRQTFLARVDRTIRRL